MVCTTYSAGMVVVVKEKLRMLVDGGMRCWLNNLLGLGQWMDVAIQKKKKKKCVV